jgi:hypothetical protein
MAENTQADANQGIASLVGGLIEDSQRLFKQEVALARHEMQEQWDKAKAAGAMLSSGLAVLALAGILLGIMVAKLLLLAGLPDWACYAITGVAFAIIGGALCATGMAKLNQISLVPPQTAETLREDVQTISAAVTTGPAHPLVRR